MSHGIHFYRGPEVVSVLISLTLIALAFSYLYGWLRIRSASLNIIPLSRAAAFTVGLFLMWIAMASPLASLDHTWLTAHMLKHLLLMTISAPLILLAQPKRPLLRAASKWFVGRGLTIERKIFSFIKRFVGSIVVGWFAGALTVVAWHVPWLFRLGLSANPWHVAEDLSFFCAGLVFWSPIVKHWTSHLKSPEWWAPTYLFLATLPCDILAAFLTFCGRVVYPNYLSVSSGVSALQDQEWAGALMWVWVTFAYMIPAVAITVGILGPAKGEAALT